jgi:hypothetical protein
MFIPLTHPSFALPSFSVLYNCINFETATTVFQIRNCPLLMCLPLASIKIFICIYCRWKKKVVFTNALRCSSLFFGRWEIERREIYFTRGFFVLDQNCFWLISCSSSCPSILDCFSFLKSCILNMWVGFCPHLSTKNQTKFFVFSASSTERR